MLSPYGFATAKFITELLGCLLSTEGHKQGKYFPDASASCSAVCAPFCCWKLAESVAAGLLSAAAAPCQQQWRLTVPPVLMHSICSDALHDFKALRVSRTIQHIEMLNQIALIVFHERTSRF